MNGGFIIQTRDLIIHVFDGNLNKECSYQGHALYEDFLLGFGWKTVVAIGGERGEGRVFREAGSSPIFSTKFARLNSDRTRLIYQNPNTYIIGSMNLSKPTDDRIIPHFSDHRMIGVNPDTDQLVTQKNGGAILSNCGRWKIFLENGPLKRP